MNKFLNWLKWGGGWTDSNTMGSWYTWAFSFILGLMLQLAPPPQALAGFEGCPEWCRLKLNLREGPPAPRDQKRFEACMEQTRREGRCGSASSTPSTPRRSTPAAPSADENSQQNNSANAGRVPCDGRCPISECVDVNGSGRDYQCRMDLINGTGQQSANDCSAQYNELVAECSAAVQETSHTCDEKNDTGMNSVGDMASQLSLMFGQQTAGSVQAACSKMASLSAAANAAVAAYRMTCSNSIRSCRSACSRVLEFVQGNPTCRIQGYQGTVGSSSVILENAESQASRCDAFEGKVQQANQAISNYAGTMANASQCGADTAGDSQAIAQLCVTNPNLPGCKDTGPVDCTKPEMAANKVCICSRNPTDPTCLNQSDAKGTAVYGSTDPSSRLNAKTGGENYLGELPDLPPIQPGRPSSGGAGEAIDGRQGGSAGIASLSGGGSGGGGGSSAAAEGEGDADAGHGVTAGFYGGGGGFGGYGRGAGVGGSGAAQRSASPGAGGGPDLRQFLPGGKYDPQSRGVAGASGPDGITGPHSNIWRKIQNRYQVLSPTLMP